MPGTKWFFVISIIIKRRSVSKLLCCLWYNVNKLALCQSRVLTTEVGTGLKELFCLRREDFFVAAEWMALKSTLGRELAVENRFCKWLHFFRRANWYLAVVFGNNSPSELCDLESPLIWSILHIYVVVIYQMLLYLELLFFIKMNWWDCI